MNEYLARKWIFTIQHELYVFFSIWLLLSLIKFNSSLLCCFSASVFALCWNCTPLRIIFQEQINRSYLFLGVYLFLLFSIFRLQFHSYHSLKNPFKCYSQFLLNFRFFFLHLCDLTSTFIQRMYFFVLFAPLLSTSLVWFCFYFHILSFRVRFTFLLFFLGVLFLHLTHLFYNKTRK